MNQLQGEPIETTPTVNTPMMPSVLEEKVNLHSVDSKSYSELTPIVIGLREFYLGWSLNLPSFMRSFQMNIIPVFLVTLSNSKNWNVDSDELALITSLLFLSFSLGMLIAPVVSLSLHSMSPKWTFLSLKFLTALEEALFAIGDIRLMIILRFIEGILYNLKMSIATSIAPVLFPKEVSDNNVNRHSMVYEVSSLAIVGIALFDDEGAIFWRVVVLSHATICLLDAIIILIFFFRVDSIQHLCKNKHRGNAIYSACHYLSRERATLFVEEIQDFVDKEREQMKENAKQMKSSTHDEASIKKSPQGACQEIKLYSKEFYFGIKLGFFMTISFYPIFYSIPLILTTSDISNPNEVSLSKMFMFIGTLGNTGLLIANRVYPFLKKRKISFLGGWLILVLSWGFILISYITKNFIFSKFSIPLFYVGCGGMQSTIFQVYLSDVCPQTIASIVYTVLGLGSLIQNSVGPFIFKNNASYLQLVIGIGVIVVITSISLIWAWFSLIETHYMTKKQIFMKLRNIRQENYREDLAEDVVAMKVVSA